MGRLKNNQVYKIHRSGEGWVQAAKTETVMAAAAPKINHGSSSR